MPTIPTWQLRSEWVAYISIALAAFFIPLSTSLLTIFLYFGTIVYWCSGNWDIKWQSLKNNPLTYWVVALLLLYLLGSIYSTGSLSDILHDLLRYGKFALIPLLLPLFTDEKKQTTIINAFIAGVVFSVIMSFFKIFGAPIINQSFDPNCAFHEHIITSWAVAVAIYLLAHKLFDRLRPAANLKPAFIIASIALIIFLCVYLFGFNTGRSGLLLFAVLLIVFFGQRFSFKFLFVGLFAVVLLFGSAYYFSNNFRNILVTAKQHLSNYQKNSQNNQYVDETSESLRLQFWTNSISLIKSHPWLGTGTGSFTKEYQQFPVVTSTNNPHNEYLLFGVQFGIFGMLFLLAWFVYLLYLTKFLEPAIKYSAQVFILSYIIGCLFNSWLRDAVNGYAFALMTAMFYARLINVRGKTSFATNDKIRESTKIKN